MAAPSTTNPYPGPRPFRAGERLYGRDRELTELFYLLSAERIVVLHSPSGAGKSSLLNAGLVPRLRAEDFDVWPSIRLSEPAADGGNRFVRSAVSSLEEGLPEGRRRPAETLAGETLAEYIAGRPHRPGAPPSVVLVFDQFEEILTLDPLGVDARQEFFRQLGEALENPDVWALFSLREDYLGALDPHRDDVPTRLGNTFRIDRLTVEAARDAIAKPAHDAGREFDPDAARQLAEDLATVSVQQPDDSFRNEKGLYVEPLQLQVVCRRLWDELPADARTIGVEHLQESGDVDAALGQYYDGCLAELSLGEIAAERRVREWFGEELITAAGIRGQVIRERERSGGLENGLIEGLRDTHLVRAEQRAGATWYELAHDRLIAPVRDSNSVWFEDKLQPWQRQAKLWKDQNEPESLLLRGDALWDAEAWARENPAAADETEKKLVAESINQRRAEQRRRRVRGLIVGSLLGVSFVIAVLYVQANHATNIAMRATASARSVALASAAKDQPAAQLDVALLLSLEADRVRDTAQARASMISALDAFRRTGAKVILHSGQSAVFGVAFSPDGSTLAAAGSEGEVVLWDAAHGYGKPRVLDSGQSAVYGIAFSPDGSTLAAAGSEGKVVLWDAAHGYGKPRVIDRGQSAVYGVAFSADGSTLAAAGFDRKVVLWDAAHGYGKLRALDSGQRVVYGVVFSPDGSTLAAAGSEGKVVLWDAAHGYGKLRALDSGQRVVYGVAFSPDGSTLAAAGFGGKVVLWDAAHGYGRLRALDSGQRDLLGVVFSPDGSTLAAASRDRKVVLWDAARGYGKLRALDSGQSDVTGVVFSTDGRMLAAAGDGGKVVLWDAAHGYGELRALDSGQRVVYGVAFSPDGSTLAAAGSEGEVVLWDAAHRYGKLASLDSGQVLVFGVAFSPDGSTLAAAGSEGKVVLWDAAHGYGKPRALDSGQSAVDGVAFSPDGSTLAAAGDGGKVVLWDAAHGYGKPRALDSGQSAVDGVAFSPDGSTLAAAGDGGKVVLWDAAHGYGKPRALDSGQRAVTGVAFSPDGSTLAAAGSEGKVVLWDAAHGYGKPRALDSGQSALYGVAFSPDGSTLAAAADAGKVVLWDAAHDYGRLVALDSGQSGVDGVAFSPDGSTLAAAGGGKVAVWDFFWQDSSDEKPFAALKAKVCGLVHGNLTEQEWVTVAPGLPYSTTCRD